MMQPRFFGYLSWTHEELAGGSTGFLDDGRSILNIKDLNCSEHFNGDFTYGHLFILR